MGLSWGRGGGVSSCVMQVSVLSKGVWCCLFLEGSWRSGILNGVFVLGVLGFFC